MTVLGLGTDLVEIPRLASALERHGESFVARVFLPSERAYCGQQSFPARCYAARFAAKEAVAKAFATGIGAQLGWLDIEITRSTDGAPGVLLHGTGAETARRLGITSLMLSLSHTEHYATATVIALGAG